MRVRVAALIFQKEKVLTLHYRYGENDVFALPGGNPDPGETLEEAILRELREEIQVGCEAVSLSLIGEVTSWNGREDVLHCIFRAVLDESTPTLDKSHSSALGLEWLSLKEVNQKILYPNIGQILSEPPMANVRHIGKIDQPYLS